MKKIITIFIAVLYMGVASGATVHIHYCMDKLVNMTLTKEDDKKCSKCGMEDNDTGCCKKIARQLAPDSDHKAADAGYPGLQAPAYAAPVYLAVPSAPLLTTLSEAYPIANAPPGAVAVPLFIRHCSYLI